MAAIRWSLAAQDDLREIESFVARDSPTYAVRLTDRLLNAVEGLSQFPRLGRIVPEFQREDLRELIHRPFRLVYLLAGETAIVLRVVHGARDLVSLVEREPWDLTE